MVEPIKTQSKHFNLWFLADGVYTAIHQEGGSAICNAGLIDLGGLLVVFDTFLTPQAAQDLYQFAINEFSQAPQFVINSHYHNDHIWGNQVFAQQAQIISSTITFEQFNTLGGEEYEWYTANAPKKHSEIQKQYQQAPNEQSRQSLIGMLGYYTGLVEALPTLKVCKPNLTFNKHLNLFGDQRPARLITYSGGHTESDTVLYLPEDGIIFTSDLLFVNTHPYLSEGDPKALLQVLNELLTLNASIFIPGHGPIGTVEDIRSMINYIEDCLSMGEKLAQAGIEYQALSDIPVPEKYKSWGLPHMFQGNIASIYKRVKTSA